MFLFCSLSAPKPIPPVLGNADIHHPDHYNSNHVTNSIQLTQTPQRRMQITLPENTTHIVICTSGAKGNNNKNDMGTNSLTLDINPDSNGQPNGSYCNQGSLCHKNGCRCSRDLTIKQVPANLPTVLHSSFKTNAECNLNGYNDVTATNSHIKEPILPETDRDSIERNRQSNYNCGECGKTYSTSSNLARHRQTHR